MQPARHEQPSRPVYQGAPDKGGLSPVSVPSNDTTQPQVHADLQPGAAVHPYVGLALATVAVSFAAILIKESTAQPITTAAYRLALTTVLLLPLVGGARRQCIRALSGRNLTLIVAAGCLLALHFAFWTASLSYTTVASSVLFVSIHPALVAALGWPLLGERLSRRALAGILLTLLGSVIVAGGDLRLSATAFRGDGLAVLGAIALAGYLLIGRAARPRLDNISYSTLVYAVCTLALIGISFLARQALLPVSGHDLLIFLGLAVICTLGGHLLYNWTLRYVPAVVVSVSFLGEPVIASLLAWPILGQSLMAGTIAGGLVILAGIWLTAQA
ncbi:MAG TPA: DMT family transporter [Chloroflexota bacterium]|nr:DMT family transporter [Chloroflexota bacterium]